MWQLVRNPEGLSSMRIDRALKLMEVALLLGAEQKLRGGKPNHEDTQERIERRGPRGSHNKFCPR